MSIVDDPHDVTKNRRGTARGERRDGTRDKRPNARDSGLWHVTDPHAPPWTPSKAPSPGPGAAPVHPGAVDGSAADGAMWKSRIDLVLSASLSGDADQSAGDEAFRHRSRQDFDAFRSQCAGELRPVLESSAAMLQEWGLGARVTETLKDQPSRLPRTFELALWVDRFAQRGPGRLTITSTEACDFVRVKIQVGPTWTGDVDEHVGTTVARDLSDALVGGLVATLVERIFG
jgi:hypothetical protein